MNLWGTGPFDNDSAGHFLAEVVQDGAVALQEAFEVVLDPDMDDVPAEEGHRALAAAEILAAVLHGDTARITDAALRAWVQHADRPELLPLRGLAQEALARVLGPDSELPDLWEDAADAGQWRTGVQDLRQRLG